MIDGRSPVPHPLAYDDDVGAIITWLPFDPRLPALAEPRARAGSAVLMRELPTASPS